MKLASNYKLDCLCSRRLKGVGEEASDSIPDMGGGANTKETVPFAYV